MIDFSQKRYANILAEMLGRIPDTYDKRDTSPIPTALGPAAYGLEDFYFALDQVQRGAFIQTAAGDDLDQLALVGGITRSPASAAVRVGFFTGSIAADDLIGTRYSTLNGSNSINFIAEEEYTRTLTASVVAATWEASPLGGNNGTFNFTYSGRWTHNGNPVSLATYGITSVGPYTNGDVIRIARSGSLSITATVVENEDVISLRMVAETVGNIGNEYAGTILPISVISGLNSAFLGDILVLGDDMEDDTDLRERLIESLTEDPFAGNISAYKNHVRNIDGVGAVQVYPNGEADLVNPTGAGTVTLSILGTDYLPASEYVVAAVQEDVDPETGHGIGLGYAPIGASVYVYVPDPVDIDVEATVTLAPGVTLGQVEPLINASIENYLLEIRRSWDKNVSQAGVEYTATVYLSRITSAIVNTQGVVNATDVTISGEASDYVLTETGTQQEIPVKGTVVINE